MPDPAQPPLNPPPTGSNKAIASIASGAASVIVVYIVNQVIPHPLPAEIVAAVQTLLTTLAVWLTPHGGA